MPLIQSSSKEALGKNIQKETEAGKPRKQAIAIGLAVARKNGGHIGLPRRKIGVKKSGGY